MIVLLLAFMDTMSASVDIPAWVYVVLVIWWLLSTVARIFYDL